MRLATILVGFALGAGLPAHAASIAPGDAIFWNHDATNGTFVGTDVDSGTKTTLVSGSQLSDQSIKTPVGVDPSRDAIFWNHDVTSGSFLRIDLDTGTKTTLASGSQFSDVSIKTPVAIVPVPEPSTFLLMTGGLLALAMTSNRSRLHAIGGRPTRRCS
jgi:hypothetical protein